MEDANFDSEESPIIMSKNTLYPQRHAEKFEDECEL